MAINTQNKRRSTLCALPIPNGYIAIDDEMQVCWQYRGVSSSMVIAVPSSRKVVVAEEHRDANISQEDRIVGVAE